MAEEHARPGKVEGECILANTETIHTPLIYQCKLFFALSRTPHGLIDMATPALAAFLCLGKTPPTDIIILGLLTAFAGYTAVYALNDIVDYPVDREKFQEGNLSSDKTDLDAAFVRHPLAQGILRYRLGLVWGGFWALVALIGAYLLHPLCAVIFLIGCFLEALYCKLLQITYWRTMISGIVKTLGGVAAVIAVNPHTSFFFLAILFIWLFTWEIGGQNIPNDWMDLDEDRTLNVKTIPVHLGPEPAGTLIVILLIVSSLANFFLFLISPIRFDPLMLIATIAVIGYLLLWPAHRLRRQPTASRAAILFNRASYYPLCLLGIVILSYLIAL